MPMNLVQITGVIALQPGSFIAHGTSSARSRLHINEQSQHEQLAAIVASGQAADDLLQYAVGDRVLIEGKLSVSKKTGKLQILIHSIRTGEVFSESSPLTHHMTIPVMGARL